MRADSRKPRKGIRMASPGDFIAASSGNSFSQDTPKGFGLSRKVN
jgi:hypothetical protein